MFRRYQIQDLRCTWTRAHNGGLYPVSLGEGGGGKIRPCGCNLTMERSKGNPYNVVIVCASVSTCEWNICLLNFIYTKIRNDKHMDLILIW